MSQPRNRPLRQVAAGLVRGAVALTLLALVLPVLFLIPGALISVSPSGTVRPTLFPIAVAVFDPFLWICVRNSAIVAFLSSAIALGIGVSLGRIVGPQRFWGRPLFAALSWVPLAALPGFLALGLAEIISPHHLGQALARRTAPIVLGQTWEQWIAWALLIWSNVARSAPLIALSTTAVLTRVDPDWTDAGRVLGASKRRAWRQLVWPIIRPEVARMLAAVFAFTLLDPTAPIVLGLRRTLPFQIVDAVTRPEPTARLAILGLISLGTALLGRALVRWWGGPRVDIDQLDRADRPVSAVWWRATLRILVLLLWLAFSWLPLIGLGQIVLGRFEPDSERAWVVSLASVVYAVIDADTRTLWMNSLFLGAATTLICVILNQLQRAFAFNPDRPSLLILGFERTPPLVLGLASAILPGVLFAAGSKLHIPALVHLATWLNPVRWPSVLLIAATVASRLPTITRATDRARLRSRPERYDAAISLGASRRHARRLQGGRGAGLGVLILTFTLAATSAAPAIALGLTSRSRPVGVGFVIGCVDHPRAAALAFGAIALNLIGLVAARRGRSGPAGDWFRG